MALRQAVRTAPISQRQIEQAAGWSRGYLSQVLQGHITLTVEHVVAVLQALDRDLVEFIGQALGEPTGNEALSEIRERLAEYDAAFDELRRNGLLPPQKR